MAALRVLRHAERASTGGSTSSRRRPAEGFAEAEPRTVFPGDDVDRRQGSDRPASGRRLAGVDLLPSARHRRRTGPDDDCLMPRARTASTWLDDMACAPVPSCTGWTRAAREHSERLYLIGRAAYDGRATEDENWSELNRPRPGSCAEPGRLSICQRAPRRLHRLPSRRAPRFPRRRLLLPRTTVPPASTRADVALARSLTTALTRRRAPPKRDPPERRRQSIAPQTGWCESPRGAGSCSRRGGTSIRPLPARHVRSN